MIDLEVKAREKIESKASKVAKGCGKRALIETRYGPVIFITFSVGCTQKIQRRDHAKNALEALIKEVELFIGNRNVRLYWRGYPTITWIDDSEPPWQGWKARCRVGFVDLDTKQPMDFNSEGKGVING